MERSNVLEWFERNPAMVQGDAAQFVSRCEEAVRRHAREAAWMAARHYVEQQRHDLQEHHGAHASEAYVAREVCEQLSEELLRNEPDVCAGSEEQLAGELVKTAVTSAGWEALVPWILEIGREEEHLTWLAITEYTKQRAKDLIRSHHLSDSTDLDHTACYGEVARRIERLLERDFEHHALSH